MTSKSTRLPSLNGHESRNGSQPSHSVIKSSFFPEGCIKTLALYGLVGAGIPFKVINTLITKVFGVYVTTSSVFSHIKCTNYERFSFYISPRISGLIHGGVKDVYLDSMLVF